MLSSSQSPRREWFLHLAALSATRERLRRRSNLRQWRCSQSDFACWISLTCLRIAKVLRPYLTFVQSLEICGMVAGSMVWCGSPWCSSTWRDDRDIEWRLDFTQHASGTAMVPWRVMKVCKIRLMGHGFLIPAFGENADDVTRLGDQSLDIIPLSHNT